jgi:hypothetical protein
MINSGNQKETPVCASLSDTSLSFLYREGQYAVGLFTVGDA